MDIKKFIKENEINVNETQDWIDLIDKFIKENNLKSELIENEYGQGIELYSEEESDYIEQMLYLVEETTTTLEYIFDGNVYVGLGESFE